MQVSSAVLQLREPRPTVNGEIAIIALDCLELTALGAARDVFGNDEQDRGDGDVENSGELLDGRNVVEHAGAVFAGHNQQGPGHKALAKQKARDGMCLPYGALEH